MPGSGSLALPSSLRCSSWCVVVLALRCPACPFAGRSFKRAMSVSAVVVHVTRRARVRQEPEHLAGAVHGQPERIRAVQCALRLVPLLLVERHRAALDLVLWCARSCSALRQSPGRLFIVSCLAIAGLIPSTLFAVPIYLLRKINDQYFIWRCDTQSSPILHYPDQTRVETCASFVAGS